MLDYLLNDRSAFLCLLTGSVAIGANYGTLRPGRISMVNRIVTRVRIEVEVIFAADGVGL